MIGVEAGKTIEDKRRTGFVAKYLSGGAILDIGYRGYTDAEPVVAQAIGIELDYPGYDGRTLPFPDRSQDAVFSSHCLEHIEDFRNAIREWHRVLKVGGFLIIAVPHQFLYEKRRNLPSRWNADHKRFYTPASLLAEVELSLAPNSYRVRQLSDNDLGYVYAIPPEQHAGGCYEIELVLERIEPPAWELETPPSEPKPEHRSATPALQPVGVAAVLMQFWAALPAGVRHAIPRGLRARGARYLWRGPADRGGATPSVPP